VDTTVAAVSSQEVSIPRTIISSVHPVSLPHSFMVHFVRSRIEQRLEAL